MLRKVCLTAAVFALAAMPALAASECGVQPIAPEIPSASVLNGKTPDAAHAVVLDVLKNVKLFQTSVGPYYDCLDRQVKQATDAIDAAKAKAKGKPDESTIAALKQQIDEATVTYSKTHDIEVRVASEYNVLHDAYCKLGPNLKGCPPTK
jgi:hypothetical protein